MFQTLKFVSEDVAEQTDQVGIPVSVQSLQVALQHSDKATGSAALALATCALLETWRFVFEG